MLNKQMEENLRITLVIEWYGIRTEKVEETEKKVASTKSKKKKNKK